MQTASLVTSMIGASAVMVWRLRETQRPVTLKKIIIPPLAMSTGFCMFFNPLFRIPLSWALAAFLLGLLVFSVPLIRTTTLSIHEDQIYLRRSKAFIAVILALAAVRLGMRNYFEGVVSIPQTGALGFVLAFGMIVRWRANMFFGYQRLCREIVARGD